jgi:tol-pal system protein YbgF
MIFFKPTMYKKILFSMYVFAITIFPQQGHALFDDKEARKKIFAVEAQMIESDEAAQAEISQLKQQILDLQNEAKNQGLTQLNEIQALTNELAQLKGDLELATHQVEALQQREKELYVDTDERIRKLEEVILVQQQAQEAAAIEAAAITPEMAHFTEADSLLQTEQYVEAFKSFDSFVNTYPQSEMADQAMYRLGFSQFSIKNYQLAIGTQEKLLKLYPDSPKAAEAMMNIGDSQIQLGRVKGAKATFRNLIKQHPDSELVPTAKSRLKALAAF